MHLQSLRQLAKKKENPVIKQAENRMHSVQTMAEGLVKKIDNKLERIRYSRKDRNHSDKKRYIEEIAGNIFKIFSLFIANKINLSLNLESGASFSEFWIITDRMNVTLISLKQLHKNVNMSWKRQ